MGLGSRFRENAVFIGWSSITGLQESSYEHRWGWQASHRLFQHQLLQITFPLSLKGFLGYFYCFFFIHPSMIPSYQLYFFREFFFFCNLLSILTGLKCGVNQLIQHRPKLSSSRRKKVMLLLVFFLIAAKNIVHLSLLFSQYNSRINFNCHLWFLYNP